MRADHFKQCALAVVIAAGLQMTSSAEEGRPSRATLEAMGLAGMVVASEETALEVRGLGFGSDGSHASVYGRSFAYVAHKGAHAGSKNGYDATGHHHAHGANHSQAQLEIEHSGGKHHKPKHHGNYGGWGKKHGGHHGDKGGKHHGGGWGKKGGGHHGGGWGKKGGGHHGGGRHHGGKTTIKASAGGWSKASAH